jgi:hypothetical protein
MRSPRVLCPGEGEEVLGALAALGSQGAWSVGLAAVQAEGGQSSELLELVVGELQPSDRF